MHLSRRHFLASAAAFGAVAVATHAGAGVLAAALQLDPTGMIRRPLLDQALAAFNAHSGRVTRKDALYVVDFSLHSSKPRLFRVNLNSGAVTAVRTAHGLGSDPQRTGFAKRFSNTPNSDASSLGAYVTAGMSAGKRDGANVLLDGLDASNSEARARAIIVHAADYCEPSFLKAHGQLGRSDGCLALSHGDLAALRADFDSGTLIYAAA